MIYSGVNLTAWAHWGLANTWKHNTQSYIYVSEQIIKTRLKIEGINNDRMMCTQRTKERGNLTILRRVVQIKINNISKSYYLIICGYSNMRIWNIPIPGIDETFVENKQ